MDREKVIYQIVFDGSYGEQSMKSLRGAKSLDIIFAGTQNRKSLGFEEASLIFEKTDGSLPIEYTEVTLTMLNKSTVNDVTAETLIADGIISKANDGIVVLATGNLDKKLNVKATRFTAKAKEKIEALGGKAEVI